MPMTSPLTTHQALSELKKILVEDMDTNLRVEEIDDEVSLLDDGLALDSILLVELITHLENKLDFEFDDADLRVASFSSLRTLADLVTRRVETAV